MLYNQNCRKFVYFVSVLAEVCLHGNKHDEISYNKYSRKITCIYNFGLNDKLSCIKLYLSGLKTKMCDSAMVSCITAYHVIPLLLLMFKQRYAVVAFADLAVI